MVVWVNRRTITVLNEAAGTEVVHVEAAASGRNSREDRSRYTRPIFPDQILKAWQLAYNEAQGYLGFIRMVGNDVSL